MANLNPEIRAAAADLKAARLWFQHEVMFWRAMGDDNVDPDCNVETIGFSTVEPIDLNCLMDRMFAAEQMLDRFATSYIKEPANDA